jgi:hypothetical protein
VGHIKAEGHAKDAPGWDLQQADFQAIFAAIMSLIKSNL